MMFTEPVIQALLKRCRPNHLVPDLAREIVKLEQCRQEANKARESLAKARDGLAKAERWLAVAQDRCPHPGVSVVRPTAEAEYHGRCENCGKDLHEPIPVGIVYHCQHCGSYPAKPRCNASSCESCCDRFCPEKCPAYTGEL